ncbi:MAG: GYF domain-containing protein [Luteolibacter sp.]
MTQWFYAKNGEQRGPISFEELKALASQAELSPSDLVWNTSMKDWLPASAVDGIFTAPVGSNPYAPPSTPWETPTTGAVVYGEEIAPGSDPIQPVECIKRGWGIAKKQFAPLLLGTLVFLAIVTVVNIPFSLAQQAHIAKLGGAPVPQGPNDIFASFQWGMRAQLNIVHLLGQLVIQVISAFLLGGLCRISLNSTDGLQASVGQIFGQGDKLVRLLLISLLLSVPMWIGNLALAYLPLGAAGVIYTLSFLVTIVAWLRLGFASFAVVDRNHDVAGALKYSASITRNNSIRLVGFSFLCFLIAMLGVTACGVGLLIAFPIILVSSTVAYRWMQYGRPR